MKKMRTRKFPRLQKLQCHRLFLLRQIKLLSEKITILKVSQSLLTDVSLQA